MTISNAPSARTTGTATAYWTVGPEQGELRPEDLPEPGPGEALVRSLYSGISKGTEMVVHNARVPDCVADAMAAPHQEGSFPGPVKFGYLSVQDFVNFSEKMGMLFSVGCSVQQSGQS